MKTKILILDSEQGQGSANRFIVRLNDSITRCVHTQLRQVILTGMKPSNDYVYVRSSKLGSNVISAKGFGAFDVVPVSTPFQYERYTAVPRIDEFECGRMLNDIDITLVNPDNSIVELDSVFFINSLSLFELVYKTNFDNGSSQSASVLCEIPQGTYNKGELVRAIQNALKPISLPSIQFDVRMPSNKLQVAMNWTSQESNEVIKLLDTTLFGNLFLTANYQLNPPSTNTIISGVSSVSIPKGSYSKDEFVKAVKTALIPCEQAIARNSSSAEFVVSLDDEDTLIINLNWKSLSYNNQVFIRDSLLFSGIKVTAAFENTPSISNTESEVKIQGGAYTTDALVKAIQDALDLTALGMEEVFKHAEFFVSVSPQNDLVIQLNWVCGSYGSLLVVPPNFRLIDSIVLEAEFSDDSTQTTSNIPSAYIPAGNYNNQQIIQAVNDSLKPISTALVESNKYDSAVFSTEIVDNKLTINLDWVCSSYSDMVLLNATTFLVTMVVTNQAIYHETAPAGMYNRPADVVATNSGTFTTRVTIPPGRYAVADVYSLIQTQLSAAANNNNGNPNQNNPYSLSLNDRNLTISANGHLYGYYTTGVTDEGGGVPIGFYQHSYNCVISITFDTDANATDLAVLGFNKSSTYVSVSLTGNQNPPIPITPSLSVVLCPSFPPSLESVVGTLTFGDGDTQILGTGSGNTLNGLNVSFTNNNLQQRTSWTFENSVRFPVLESVDASLNGNSNGWIFSAPQIIQQTPEQYSFIWKTPLYFPQLLSSSAELVYDKNNANNSVLGLQTSTQSQLVSVMGESTSFGEGMKQFTWTLGQLSYLDASSVESYIVNSSSQIGGWGTPREDGDLVVFNANQRQFNWEFNPITASSSKATIVVEITTI